MPTDSEVQFQIGKHVRSIIDGSLAGVRGRRPPACLLEAVRRLQQVHANLMGPLYATIPPPTAQACRLLVGLSGHLLEKVKHMLLNYAALIM